MAYRAAHKEERKAYDKARKEQRKAYDEAHKEQIAAYRQRLGWATSPYWAHVREHYSITPEQLSEIRWKLAAAQGWRCANCGHAIGNRDGERKPNLDHSKHHNWLRGMVCGMPCNRLLGNYSATQLREAAAYIENTERMALVDRVIKEVKDAANPAPLPA